MRANEGGFTLIETLVAMTVLTIGIFALYSMQVASMRGNHVANVISQASNLAAQQLEDLQIRKFEGLRLKDRNKNSEIGSDPDKAMGMGDFGLDDGVALKPNGEFYPIDECERQADRCEDTKDGLYRIIWNVADDYPVIGLKTIRMHVRSKANPQLRPVTYELIRNDPDTGI